MILIYGPTRKNNFHEKWHSLEFRCVLLNPFELLKRFFRRSRLQTELPIRALILILNWRIRLKSRGRKAIRLEQFAAHNVRRRKRSIVKVLSQRQDVSLAKRPTSLPLSVGTSANVWDDVAIQRMFCRLVNRWWRPAVMSKSFVICNVRHGVECNGNCDMARRISKNGTDGSNGFQNLII